MIHWLLNIFIVALLAVGFIANVLAHVPVPLDKVPAVVLESVIKREPGMIMHEASVDVSHSAVPIENVVVTYVIKGTSSQGKEIAVEVTNRGLVLQIYDRVYYEEYIED